MKWRMNNFYKRCLRRVSVTHQNNLQTENARYMKLHIYPTSRGVLIA